MGPARVQQAEEIQPKVRQDLRRPIRKEEFRVRGEFKPLGELVVSKLPILILLKR